MATGRTILTFETGSSLRATTVYTCYNAQANPTRATGYFSATSVSSDSASITKHLSDITTGAVITDVSVSTSGTAACKFNNKTISAALVKNYLNSIRSDFDTATMTVNFYLNSPSGNMRLDDVYTNGTWETGNVTYIVIGKTYNKTVYANGSCTITINWDTSATYVPEDEEEDTSGATVPHLSDETQAKKDMGLGFRIEPTGVAIGGLVISSDNAEAPTFECYYPATFENTVDISEGNFSYQPQWYYLGNYFASGITCANKRSEAPYFCKDKNFVHIRGRIKTNGATTSGTAFTIATLPTGYRPSHTYHCPIVQGNTTNYNRIHLSVSTTGVITATVFAPNSSLPSIATGSFIDMNMSFPLGI